jgi:TetR/AcrR family transcriptional regulator, regulator of cefoperazone and chloramphenicol sensitivity
MSKKTKDTGRTTAEPEGGRQRIILAAMKLFGERGFDGASVRDIAAEAGVSLGLLRHHFGSKEGVRAAVGTTVIERFITFLGGQPENDLVNPLTTMAEESVRRVTEDPERVRAGYQYFRRAVFEADEAAREYIRVYRSMYTDIAKRLISCGQWRDDIDLEMVVFQLMARDFGEIFLWPYAEEFFGASLLSRQGFARMVAVENELLERGVACPKAAPAGARPRATAKKNVAAASRPARQKR